MIQIQLSFFSFLHKSVRSRVRACMSMGVIGAGRDISGQVVTPIRAGRDTYRGRSQKRNDCKNRF